MSQRDELMEILHAKGAYCGNCDYETGGCPDCAECLGAYADAVLAAGYIKADSEEFVVRRGGITYPQIFGTPDEAQKWAKGFAARSVETEVVRRLVGPWEVA